MYLSELKFFYEKHFCNLLAISGLHMGLLTGFIFTVLRLAVLFLPGSARHWPAKKIAACGAILAGAFYLALSGGNVATERAFVMVLVGFGALFFDKRAQGSKGHRGPKRRRDRPHRHPEARVLPIGSTKALGGSIAI